MDFLHKIISIVVLDEEGYRVFAKYYTDPVPEPGAAAGGAAAAASSPTGALQTLESQRMLELGVHRAARVPKRQLDIGGEPEIMMHDGYTVLYTFGVDVMMMVVGGPEENELVLCSVLNALTGSLKQEFDSQAITKRQLLQDYDALLLIVDEIIDDGIILETNSNVIVNEIEPFVAQSNSENARKTFEKVNKYLKENL